MTALTVFLDIDLSPQPSGVFAYYAPNETVLDPTDGITLNTAPQVVAFNGALQSPALYATDNPNMSPANWSYSLSFSQNPLVPGSPAPLTNFQVPAGPLTYTATSASPCVVTPAYTSAFTAAFPGGLPNGTGVEFTSGTPAGFTVNTTYYVVSAAATHFSLAATRGGAAINSTGTGSGNLQVTRYAYSGLANQTPAAPVTPYLTAAGNLAGIPSPPAAQANLGLGSAAVLNSNQVLAAQNPQVLSAGTVYNAAVNDLAVANCTTGNTTVNLPATPAQGSCVTVLLAQQNTPSGSVGAYTVTVAPQGGDVILGSATLASLYQASTWQYFGTTWYPKGGSLPSTSLPLTQTFPLVNNTYQEMFNWTVTGQTDDPLRPFGLVSGSQTYTNGATSIQGPAFWFGYNPDLLSGKLSSSAHGAIGVSCFGDAGDTNNGAGGHGLEFNPACFRSANGLASTNALEVVAVDDNTNTVNTVIRCGSGSSSSSFSSIIMEDANGANIFMVMGLSTSNQIWLYQPVLFKAATITQTTASALSWNLATSAGTANFTISAAGSLNGAGYKAVSAASTASLILNGNVPAGVSAQIAFQKNGVNTWLLEDSTGADLYLLNNSGAVQMLFVSGANASNYNAASTYILTETFNYGSFIVNNGGTALATSATDGFLYIPTCAGRPTGTPTAQAASVPLVYDTTNGRLWTYNGSWATVPAKVYDTGTSGTALSTSGTEVLMTYTAPSDGNLHTVTWSALLHVTTAGTGGNVITTIGGLYSSGNGFSASLANGYYPAGGTALVPPGDTFQVFQSVALTGASAAANFTGQLQAT